MTSPHPHTESSPAALALDGRPLDVPLPPQEVLSRLDALARRGRLPDFRPRTDGPLFEITGLGHPFEHRLLANAAQNGSGTTLSFSLRMRRRAPLVAAAILALTIWPGVWLTDSMLRTYWESYNVDTRIWYLPLTILPIPFGWAAAVRRSRESARLAALAAAQSIHATLTATSPSPRADGR